jgi:hypothetical protein
LFGAAGPKHGGLHPGARPALPLRADICIFKQFVTASLSSARHQCVMHDYVQEEIEKIIERRAILRAKWLSIVEECILSMPREQRILRTTTEQN